MKMWGRRQNAAAARSVEINVELVREKDSLLKKNLSVTETIRDLSNGVLEAIKRAGVRPPAAPEED